MGEENSTVIYADEIVICSDEIQRASVPKDFFLKKDMLLEYIKNIDVFQVEENPIERLIRLRGYSPGCPVRRKLIKMNLLE